MLDTYNKILEDVVLQLKNNNIKDSYKLHASLKLLNWLKVGGNADLLFIPENIQDLSSFIKIINNRLPISVIGAGSNILIRDGGVSGVVIRLGKGFNYSRILPDFKIITGAATPDLTVARTAMQNSITGLEFLSGIPGTIGGALSMNAGAYKRDMSLCLESATAINTSTGEIKNFSVEEMKYSYRSNGLTRGWCFLEAIITGNEGDTNEIETKMKQIKLQRNTTQPIRLKTCGSIFKNINDPQGKTITNAWQLIDQVGCRGLKVGGAEISKLHCNFLINTGNATAEDIENLIYDVQKKVFIKFGKILETEVIIMGSKIKNQ